MQNAAFIDAQNLYKGTKSLGCKIDWTKFRIYLKEKYNVGTAYLFLGFLPERQDLYAQLQKAGLILIFKSVIFDNSGSINVKTYYKLKKCL